MAADNLLPLSLEEALKPLARRVLPVEPSTTNSPPIDISDVRPTLHNISSSATSALGDLSKCGRISAVIILVLLLVSLFTWGGWKWVVWRRRARQWDEEQSIGLDKFVLSQDLHMQGSKRTLVQTQQLKRPGMLRDYRYMKLEPVLEEDEIDIEDRMV